MLRKVLWILFLQINLIEILFALHYGHEVGRTSMDSTHYDRQRFEQICSSNKQHRYLSSSNSNSISMQKQLKLNREDILFNLKDDSDAININQTDPLDMDQASLNISVDQQFIDRLNVSIQIVECINCSYEILSENLTSKASLSLTLNTKYSYRIRIEQSNISSCLLSLVPYEYELYLLQVENGNQSTNSSSNKNLICNLITKRSASHIYVPLIVAGVLLSVLFLTCIVAQRMKFDEYLKSIQKRFLNKKPPQESTQSYDLQANPPAETINASETNPTITRLPPIKKVSSVIVPRSKRLLSLDAFRGLTLVAMIFVNYGGGGYAQFDHAPWHGITFADIVFPFFVWMLGTSMVFSLKNALDKDISKRILIKKILLRTLKLFAIGFILNTRFKVDLGYVRILGVLQRFAIVYGLVAIIEVLCSNSKQYLIKKENSSIEEGEKKKKTGNIFSDITNFPLQWLVMICLVTIWLLVVYLIPFENCPAGYLGPGGLHENGSYANCTGGITGYIDRKIFGYKHLYQYPTCKPVYGCPNPYDPENLLGAIPTMFLAFLGVQAGRILAMYHTDAERLVRLFAWSIVSTAIGVGLTGGTLDGGPMPLNKNIWTLSFSFFTAGLAFAGFALMYMLVDMFKIWNGTPFQYPGTNSILIYMTHLMFASYFPVQWIVPNTHAAHLAMALWGCVFWIFIAFIFFKKRIFLVL